MPRPCVSCLAKVEQRAPQIEVATEGKAKPEVVNIMAALKQSMESKGRAQVRNAVRRRMGKPSQEKEPRPRPFTTKPKPAPNGALKLSRVLSALTLFTDN